MSDAETAKALDLEDFAELLQALDDAGIGYAVIGGLAVGAYARLRGETTVSADLDIIASERTLQDLLAMAEDLSMVVIKRPTPRSVPVALLDWRGLEVNVLTGSIDLPQPDSVIRVAREFEVRGGAFTVRVADPFDIFSNKLAVNRDKDQPHIELLRAYLQDEIVHDFEHADTPRERIGPARRYLEITGAPTLSDALAGRLIPCVADPVGARFVAGHIADQSVVEALRQHVAGGPLAETVERVLARRGIA